MMRFVAAVACALVAMDCAGKAMGSVPQELVSPQHIWVWWIVAALWALNTITIAFRGAP
jgi:hypothetical protein